MLSCLWLWWGNWSQVRQNSSSKEEGSWSCCSSRCYWTILKTLCFKYLFNLKILFKPPSFTIITIKCEYWKPIVCERSYSLLFYQDPTRQQYTGTSVENVPWKSRYIAQRFILKCRRRIKFIHSLVFQQNQKNIQHNILDTGYRDKVIIKCWMLVVYRLMI